MTKVVVCGGPFDGTRLIPDNVTMEGVLDQCRLDTVKWRCIANGEELQDEDLARPLYSFAKDSIVYLCVYLKMEVAMGMAVAAVQPDQSPAAGPSENDQLKNVYEALLNLRVAVNNAITAMEPHYVSAEELPF